MSSFSEYHNNRNTNNTISSNNTSSSSNSAFMSYHNRRLKDEEEERKRKEEQQKRQAESKKSNIQEVNTTSDLEKLQANYNKLSIKEQADIAKQVQEKENSKSAIEKITESLNKTNEPLYSENTVKNKEGGLYNIKYLEQELNPDKYFIKSSEAFKDGYQFGDVTKTAGSSVADLGVNLVEGVMGVGEGIGNLISGGVAQVADWIGKDEYANRVRNKIASNPNVLTSKIEEKIEKPLDKSSILGNKSDELAENIGQMAAYWASGKVAGELAGITGKSGATIKKISDIVNNATMFTSAAGETLPESYSKENVKNWQVRAKAIGSGVIETFTENLFGFFGKSGIDNDLINYVSDQISSGVGKTLARQGIQATSEGTEEIISYILNQGLDGLIDAIDNVSGGTGAKYKKNWNWEEVGEQFAMAALSSLIMGGAIDSSNVLSNLKNSNSLSDAINLTAQQKDIAKTDNFPLPTAQDTLNSQNEALPVQNEQYQYENRNRNARLEELKNIDTSNMGIIERGKIKTEIRALEQGFNSIEEYKKAEQEKKEQAEQEYKKKQQEKQQEKENAEKQKKLQLENDIKESSPMQNAQFEIIQNTNPMLDDYHTGIRSPKEIKKFGEVINDEESFTWGDFSREDAERALQDGKITIYSSYPIENGIFVSTSKVEVEDYAGGRGNKVYSKTVPLNEVAWINGDEGQYAKVGNNPNNNNINIFKNAKNSVSRETIEKISDNIKIPLKEGAEYVYDTKMSKKSGNNENPKITNIDNIFSGITKNNIKDFREKAIEKALSLFRNKTITIKDTQTATEINKSGIKETYSKDLTESKIQSANNLNDIIAEGIYKYTTRDIDSKDGILYHNFFSPVSYNGENQIMRVVIKEYTQNDTMKDKFYYHSLELLDNIKNGSDSFLPRQSGSKTVESLPTNNSIPSSSENVNYTNNYAQTTENDTQKNNKEVNPYRNTAKANKLIKEKNEIIRQLNADLKQVTSEIAKNNIQKEINKIEKEYNDRIQKLYDEIDNKNINNTEKPTRHEVVQRNRELARENIKNISKWKDKKNGLSYQLETMERNMYDIIPNKDEARRINETYFQPVHTLEAQKQKFINQYNNKIKELNLNKFESEAVQFLGEKKYNPDFNKGDSESVIHRNEIKARIDQNIENGKINIGKVNNAIETFRNIYNELFEIENNKLRENGYKEKPYRKGYFPHFIDYVPTTKTEKVLNALGFKIDKRALPTDIAGITEQFVPGKTWNRSALERKTNKTDYNALKGFDTYIQQAADNIFHTENIQRLRGLENEIRYQYSDKGMQERIDKILNDETLFEEEKQDLIDNIFEQAENPLPNLTTELRRYTNALANKKSEADRSVENKIGRHVYSIINAIENRFGANAVGLNIGSAVTNFIPITQAYSQVSTKNMNRAIIDTVKSQINNDGFADKSDFLTSRLNQAEKLYKTNLEKATDKANIIFKGIDEVASNIVVRGKYLDNIEKGMSETEAIKDADQFARNVMADRSKGALPTIFEEKNLLTKAFTQFQLEVNNQYRYMFKDIPRDLKDKGLGTIAMAFFKMFVAAWFYNEASEEIIGIRPAFDPIDIITSSYKTITDENMGTYNKVKKIGKEIAEDLPFVGGLVGGGRVPVNGAIPNISNLTKSAIGLTTGEMDSKKALSNIGKEISKPLYYLLPPFGGAQLKKSAEGLKTVTNKGSYGIDSKGQKTLQFPVENASAKDYIKAGIFGKYALPTAKEYAERGYKSLTANQTKLYEESHIPYNELLEYIDNGLKTNEDKVNYINKKNWTTNQKWGIYTNEIFSTTERKDGSSQASDAEYITSHGVSKSDYMKIYNNAMKNDIDMPTKDEYTKIKNNNLSLKTYIDYKTQTKEKTKALEKIQILIDSSYSNKEKLAIYENYITANDSKLSIVKDLNININEYLKYKANAGTTKAEKVDYMEKTIRNVSYMDKLILLGTEYALTTNEKNMIVNYINGLNKTKDEKLEILSKIKGFTIYNDGSFRY